MYEDEIISRTITFVKEELAGAEGGHDWWHIERVWRNAKMIAREEGGDLLVIELGALLHDIADAKFHNNDENVGPQKAREFLQTLSVKKQTIEHVENIIKNISFKGGNFQSPFYSIELAIV